MSIPSTAAAFVVLSSLAGIPVDEPNPVVLVSSINVPAYVTEQEGAANEDMGLELALASYKSLRSSFDISHTDMSQWLGVKRRTLYNWKDNPERALKFGPIIEARLAALEELRASIEGEHLSLLKKIAFSPIYGDIQFGRAILDGKSSDELIQWYDKLFSRFEAYKNIKNHQA